MMDWAQVGHDFQQKYQGTYCRYKSPINGAKEVFFVHDVIPHEDKGPDISLFNERVGELYLNYETEAELDFSFPRCSNFLSDKKCFRFVKNYFRQWKKGINPQTASVVFPYNEIHPFMPVGMSGPVLEDAFKPQRLTSIKEALLLMDNEAFFSVPLSPNLSVGPSDNKDDLWLWFDSNIIGALIKTGKGLREIKLYDPIFEQEVKDFLSQTFDSGRPII